MRADGAGLRIDEIPVLYVHDARSSLKVLPASLRMLREVAGVALRLRLGRRSGAPVPATEK